MLLRACGLDSLSHCNVACARYLPRGHVTDLRLFCRVGVPAGYVTPETPRTLNDAA